MITAGTLLDCPCSMTTACVGLQSLAVAPEKEDAFMKMCRTPDQKFGEITASLLFQLRIGLADEAAVLAFHRLCSRGGAPEAAAWQRQRMHTIQTACLAPHLHLPPLCASPPITTAYIRLYSAGSTEPSSFRSMAKLSRTSVPSRMYIPVYKTLYRIRAKLLSKSELYSYTPDTRVDAPTV